MTLCQKKNQDGDDRTLNNYHEEKNNGPSQKSCPLVLEPENEHDHNEKQAKKQKHASYSAYETTPLRYGWRSAWLKGP